MIVSTEGGMNIEDVARDNPDAIVKVPVDIDNGNLSVFQVSRCCYLFVFNSNEAMKLLSC